MNIFENIISDLKEYATVQQEYWKLSTIEKLSLAVSFFVIVLLCMGFFFFAFAYFSIALVFLFAEIFGGNFAPALFIVFGINLLIIALIILFRKFLFFSPMVRLISKFLK